MTTAETSRPPIAPHARRVLKAQAAGLILLALATIAFPLWLALTDQPVPIAGLVFAPIGWALIGIAIVKLCRNEHIAAEHRAAPSA